MGGYAPIVPKAGYWRQSKTSNEISLCHNNPKACLGNDTCKEGHFGLLCEECEALDGWYKSGLADCSKCSNKEKSIIIICLIGLTYMVFQFISINAVLQRGSFYLKKIIMHRLFNYIINFENQSSAIYKIVIFHFQVIFLATTLDI